MRKFSSALIFLCLFLYFISIEAQTPDLNCTVYDNTTDTCYINQSITVDISQTINAKNIVINNSYIVCSDKCLWNQNSFKISNASQITIQNSTIYFAIIELDGENLTIIDSALSTNGTIKNGLGRTGECSQKTQDVGLGYAGSGAFCQDLFPQCGYPYGSLDLLLNETNDTNNALGTGSGQMITDFYGCGGGRVYLNMSNTFFFGQNILSASGSPQQEPKYLCTNRTDTNYDILNGGTGGYIYLEVKNTLAFNSLNDSLKILAEGGNYCDYFDGKSTKFAGSGGRIIINIDPSVGNQNIQYYIKGGINDVTVKQQNINPCRNGASGSLYFMRNKTVLFNNQGYAANTITQIPSNIMFEKITILNGARGGPEDNNLEGNVAASIINVNQAYLAYERFSTHLTINCENLTIFCGNDTGGIGPPEQNSKSTTLFIQANNSVFFGNNTMIQFGKDFNLISKNTTFGGSVQSFFYDSSLYISSELLFIQEAQIDVSAIAIHTNNNLTIKNSRLKAFKSKCKDGNTTIYSSYINLLDYGLEIKNLSPNNSTLDILHYLILENYTFFILTPKNLTFSIENLTDPNKNNIQGSNIGLFADNVNISSDFIISSEGLGCSNEQGIGKGTQDTNLGNKCGGTGGSYGGFGSLAWSNYTDILKDCLKIKSPIIYGDIDNPIYEGSGGGGNQERLNPGGKGGGVIIIVAKNNLTISGNITSSGSSPETQMGKATAGSGSGGSIQIFMKYLFGNGVVKAEGGSTQNWGIGGPGGGGRVRVNFLSWYEKGFYSANWLGKFFVNQGKRGDFVNLPDDENENMGKGSNL